MIPIQEILVLITVGAASVTALYRTWRFFAPSRQLQKGCASGCSGCSLHELKNEITAKRQHHG